MYDRVNTTFSATLGLYQNLTSLNIKQFTIDTAFRPTLQSLSQLDDLTLCDCNIIKRDGFLRLERLTISGVDNGGPPQIAAPETLRALNLDLKGEISPLLTGFGPAELRHPTHLSINMLRDADRDVPLLFHYLDQCPQLASLTINALTGESALPALDPTTVTLLRNVTAPPRLIQLFAPNRSVSDVKILAGNKHTDSQDLLRVCMDISRAADLKSLTLPPTPPLLELLVAIPGLFPELRELTLVFASIRSFRCGFMGGGHRLKDAPVNARTLELHDDDAFDNPSVDDLSDTESDNINRTVLTTPTTEYIAPEITGSSAFMYKIMGWIFGGLLSLPPTIAVMRLELIGTGLGQIFSWSHQKQAVAALAHMYPSLRKVQFEAPSTEWNRSAEEWTGQAEPKQDRLLRERDAVVRGRNLKRRAREVGEAEICLPESNGRCAYRALASNIASPQIGSIHLRERTCVAATAPVLVRGTREHEWFVDQSALGGLCAEVVHRPAEAHERVCAGGVADSIFNYHLLAIDLKENGARLSLTCGDQNFAKAAEEMASEGELRMGAVSGAFLSFDARLLHWKPPFLKDVDQFMVVARGDSNELLVSSSFADQLEDCVVYLDNVHTRGTDLKLTWARTHPPFHCTLGRARRWLQDTTGYIVALRPGEFRKLS
ncbi:hypothetical protein DFH09DRAFT_1458811 [Mycena vulgaris]|nr:hypothetical protein DFH09DRAFT_1458811 [Mycena vulgaris]